MKIIHLCIALESLQDTSTKEKKKLVSNVHSRIHRGSELLSMSSTYTLGFDFDTWRISRYNVVGCYTLVIIEAWKRSLKV